jgi:hypothetical protein
MAVASLENTDPPRIPIAIARGWAPLAKRIVTTAASYFNNAVDASRMF